MLSELNLMDYSILIAIEKINKDVLFEKYFKNEDDSIIRPIGKATNSEVIV